MNTTPSPFSFAEPMGDCVAVARDQSISYWQPVPANGYADVIFSKDNVRTVNPFTMGLQTVPPGGTVRLHAHDVGEEVLYILSGEGVATLNGQETPMSPGTAIYLGHNVTHTFSTKGDAELKLLFFFMPGGLERFFEQIGRPRTPGQPAPAPFPRLENVKQIEADTVFRRT